MARKKTKVAREEDEGAWGKNLDTRGVQGKRVATHAYGSAGFAWWWVELGCWYCMYSF